MGSSRAKHKRNRKHQRELQSVDPGEQETHPRLRGERKHQTTTTIGPISPQEERPLSYRPRRDPRPQHQWRLCSACGHWREFSVLESTPGAFLWCSCCREDAR